MEIHLDEELWKKVTFASYTYVQHSLAIVDQKYIIRSSIFVVISEKRKAGLQIQMS